ncbi:MAG TPA: 4-vinyl reductase [Leptolyngbyaceae cyanobacterium M33_DOE_097]|uniref:4-vinyl reductase n=1 Tax=Oscillatoriales cyanobacterium SpSt-418 TaxID=2282169 RepID=A0A7C3KDD1_9CYAN|nr:4-vinyl reductase [Leptolyngbyaceae cyanobacterium M33_DOE_097]
MISVADLLTNNRVPGNYFAADTYIRGDLELGILENRRGERLIAIPETMIQGIYSGLEKETGQASLLVLFNCGKWWGKNFYTRFREELTDYYGTALADLPMVDFLQCLQQCWLTYGWGKLELDHSLHNRGFLLIKTWNSPFAALAPQNKVPYCFLEAGVLASFFSQLTGRDLHCVQTTCESMGAEYNQFLIGVAPRMKKAEELVAQQLDHDRIVEALCA